MTDHPTEINGKDESTSREPQKKRNWPRRLLFLTVILLVLGFLINGPLARWAIRNGLNKALEKQGMTGAATIAGSLTSGFTISKLDYTGKLGLQKIYLEKTSIHYRLAEIINKRISRINLTNSELVIDLEKFPPSESSEPDPKAKLRNTLEKLRTWITPPEININQLHLTILKNDQATATFSLGSLTHASDSQDFLLTKFTATDHRNKSTPAQQTLLTWNTSSANIDKLEILPDIALKNLHLDWKQNPKGHAELQLLTSHWQLEAGEQIQANITRGTLDSVQLAKRLGIELPGQFNINKLNVTIRNWQAPVPQWQANAVLEVSQAHYQKYQLSQSVIQLSQGQDGYSVRIEGQLNTAPLEATINGRWQSNQHTQTGWPDTEADYTVSLEKIAPLTQIWFPAQNELNLSSAQIQAQGRVTLAKKSLTKATLNGKIQGITAAQSPIPRVDISAKYNIPDDQIKATITARATNHNPLTFNAELHPKKKNYQAKLKVSEPNPVWINALAKAFNSRATLDGAVDLTWSGNGSADHKKNQNGTLSIGQMQINLPDTTPVNVTLKANYNWPQSVEINTLNISQDALRGTASLKWDGKTINIPSLTLTEGVDLLASLSGNAPLNRSITSAKQFLAQKQPWQLTLKSQPLALKKLSDWLGIKLIDGLSGSTDINLKLTGSPSAPQISGTARAMKITGLDPAQNAPIDAHVTFDSKADQLKLNSYINEGETQRLTANGTIPFTPRLWIDDPNQLEKFLNNAPLAGNLKINALPLARFQRFLPQLDKIEGSVSGTGTLSGTFNKPLYLLDITAKAPLLRLSKSPLGDASDITLNATLKQDQVLKTELTAQLNGAKFELTGDLDISDIKTPAFDFSLQTQHALVHRDDMLSIRANTDLKLKGNLQDATLSGTIGIAESLFYKDIDLIPIGVPSSEVAKVQLPFIDPNKKEKKKSVPEPFDQWKLNLIIRTDDPVLVRGNVATGDIQGSLKVRGTIGKPEPDGTLYANNIKAKLPFSTLLIKKGEIRFSPSRGLDPNLKIRGQSTVNSHDISVFVYGPASSPKTTLNSSPPLPESEIMSLLATGTTTSELEDRDVAAFKAFQIFLRKLKQRADKPGGNRLFQAMLSGVDDLNLKVGEVDPFTGRKFASSTVELQPRWHLTAQVDNTQQTRGLIVYVFRFR